MEKITFNLPNSISSEITNKKTIDGYMYDTLTSTNDQAWTLSHQGVESPFFVIAKQQTAGRGQRGNQWQSLLGGLYVSLYLNLNLSTDNLHHLTLFSVYGIVAQLQAHRIPVQIKWLNDLILEEKKLGGILCETKINHHQIQKTVIGVGINYLNETTNEGINLQEFINKNNHLLIIDSLIDLAQIVVMGILNGYTKYQLMGINFIVNQYNKLLHNYQQNILIKENQGIILGVNQQGNLKVKLSSNNASTNIYFPPEKYHISYSKNEQNCYLLTEK